MNKAERLLDEALDAADQDRRDREREPWAYGPDLDDPTTLDQIIAGEAAEDAAAFARHEAGQD